MRDKNRIPKILNELERIWKEDPDLRLGQIIMIATRPKHPCSEVFYIEDEDILRGIQSIGDESKVNTQERVPCWKLYPEIIRVKVEDLTLELISEFVKVARQENPNIILTPRSMMKLAGAPDDIHWLIEQEERIEKLNILLIELEEKGQIKVVEIGYEIIK